MKKNSFRLTDKKRKKNLPKKVWQNYTLFRLGVSGESTPFCFSCFSLFARRRMTTKKKNRKGTRPLARIYLLTEILKWVSDQQPQTSGQHEFYCYQQKFLPLKFDTLTTALDVKQWNLWNNSSKKKKEVDTATQKTSNLIKFQDLFIFLSRVKYNVPLKSSKLKHFKLIGKEALNWSYFWNYAANNIYFSKLYIIV